MKRRLLLAGAITVVLILGCLYMIRAESLTAPSPSTTWPWKGAEQETPHLGVTHWRAVSADNTVLHLLDFDFTANTNLRLELYDRDQDDKVPFDNNMRDTTRGAGQITHEFNEQGHGQVVAMWNGSFFSSSEASMHHVAPVILNNKVYANVGRIRWTAGVQYLEGKPVFKALHEPDRTMMEKEFSYGASAIQCLVKDGVPLKLRAYPVVYQIPVKTPVPSTQQEVGYIPDIDFLKTSRTSMGWSRDNTHFYLLIVQEPDNEFASIDDFQKGRPGTGGWSLADLQRFWTSFGAWSAVNVDGGAITEMTCLRPDGNYLLLPPTWANPARELTFTPEFKDAPHGGTIMYFYIRDTGK